MDDLVLFKYTPQRRKNILKQKNGHLNNATKGRGKIIEEKLLFKNKIFSLNYDEKEEQKLNDKEVENKIRNGKGVIHYYPASTRRPGDVPEGPLKVLTSGTSREPPGDS